MRRRDKKRADKIMALIEEMQTVGDGLHFRWLSGEQLAWEVTFTVEDRTFTGTHASMEIALEWAYEQASFDWDAREHA